MMQKGQKKQQQMQGRQKTTTKTAMEMPTTSPTLETGLNLFRAMLCFLKYP